MIVYRSRGFTLIETLVVITIVGLMMMVAIAPYNLYADKARARLSGERVEQMLARAKLQTATGYSSGSVNLDLIVVLKKWSEEVLLESIEAAGSGVTIPTARTFGRNLVEKLALESAVELTGFGMWTGIGATTATAPGSVLTLDTAAPEMVLVVYRAPNGAREFWSESPSGGVPVRMVNSINGGGVGVKGATSGPRSSQFLLK
jgi:prepilin-type N-terminal cleavage/methylation domain-containing protein